MILIDYLNSAWKLNKETLEFESAKIDFFGGLGLVESTKVTCNHFTDFRASLLGGRCIFSTWIITVVVDFENFHTQIPEDIIQKRTYLYTPTFAYSDRNAQSDIVAIRQRVYPDFWNDVVVLGMRL